MLYNRQELGEVLLPVLLRTLLKAGATEAAYFEVTTEIFRSVSDVLEVSPGVEAVITTGVVRTDSGTELRPSLFAARPGAEVTLRLWEDRLRNRNLTDKAIAGIDSASTDRTWSDILSHQVLEGPGLAIGFWNLKPETFTWNGKSYEVDGKPLRSFDFRGYDLGKPHLLSRHQGLEPRILLSEWPAIARLCDEYRDKVVEAGDGEEKSASYRFDHLPGGLRIDHRMHQLYREAYQRHKRGLDKEPPSPFGPGGEEVFLQWLNEPVEQTRKDVTRYMLAVYDEREDVQKAFPDVKGTDAAGFRDWYRNFGQLELELPAAVVPSDCRSTGEGNQPLPEAPVNVAGYFRAELGLGTAARSLLTALGAAAIPFNTISFDGTANRQTHSFVDRQSGSGSADLNIVCINPDQLATFAEKAGPEVWAGRYTIGLWFWEVEDFPKPFHGAFNYVDEVWVASNFMREAFLKVSPKPVFKFKLPVLKPEIDLALSRSRFDLPDRFVFLFSFDLFSVLERKNPVGLIEAFVRAFKPGEGPLLVIKTINGEKRVLEMEKLRYAARGRPDIILRDGYLSPVENSTLAALADCYVSLHRSEGFGLTMAEAMALGKPVIATAYSGNLEFMKEANSYLVPCRRCKVGPEREPYPASSHWCEPDVEAAAGLLRHVYTHQDEARVKGLRAAEEILTFHSAIAAAAIIRERIAKIRLRRTSAYPVRSINLLQDLLEELQSKQTIGETA